VRNVFVGLLWLWLLVSLGIYAYRLYRRFTQGPKAEPEELEAPKSVAPDVPIIGPAAAATRAVPPTPAAAEAITPVVPRRSVDRPVPGPADGSTGRAGLFAPADVTPSPTERPVTSNTDARPTVAEVLHGIVMPCDLSPIVDPNRVFDPYRVAFSTNTVPAATVGAAVGDELERLDFALASTTSNQLAATKGDRRVTVTIHPEPAEVTYGDGPAFPTLPPGSVVVEFQT
jgi:hypothetical protein